MLSWNRVRRFAGLVLLAGLGACGRSAERVEADRIEIEGLLSAYAAAMTAAYESGDTTALAVLATGREVVRVDARIRELAVEGRELRPVLRSQAVESIDYSSGTSAMAVTLEVWDLRVIAVGSGAPVAESLAQKNRILYSLSRDDGRWQVLSRILRSSTESP